MGNSQNYCKKGKRHKVQYRNNDYYVSVFNCEVFLSSAAEQSDPLTAAGLEALAVLTGMCLETHRKEYVIEKLKSVSRSKMDMPGILAELLNEDKTNE